jgi:uncharacterized membrane protein YjgN (DUF898 family)
MQEIGAHESSPSAPNEPSPSAPNEPSPSAPSEPSPSAPNEASPSAPSEPTPTAPSEPTPSAPSEATPSTPKQVVAEPLRCRLQFTGTGTEYFGIWIVNLLLTIVTLGIYSAWAKVRKMQYFYRNTQLEGSLFDYHGNPVAILKGRILAVVLVVGYKLALTLLGAFALVAMAALVAALPWLLAQSYRFRLHNSSYRGLRFRFAGPTSHAYLIFGLPLVVLLAPAGLAALGLGPDAQHPDFRPLVAFGLIYVAWLLLWPYLHFSFKRWQHGYALYGTAPSTFTARAGSFYGAYLLGVVMLFGTLISLTILIGVVNLGLTAAGTPRGGTTVGTILSMVLFYSAMIAVVPFVTARLQNTVWTGTGVEGVGFSSEVRAGRLIGITLTNLLMIVLTLGLLIPFAVTRLMKYKIESIEVLDADALNCFVADRQGGQVGTTGEGAVDVMDLDFGL